MAIWLEIRCDKNLSGCYSDRNNGPKELSPHWGTSLLANVRLLKKQATEDGWLVTPHQTICPACQKTEAKP